MIFFRWLLMIGRIVFIGWEIWMLTGLGQPKTDGICVEFRAWFRISLAFWHCFRRTGNWALSVCDSDQIQVNLFRGKAHAGFVFFFTAITNYLCCRSINKRFPLEINAFAVKWAGHWHPNHMSSDLITEKYPWKMSVWRAMKIRSMHANIMLLWRNVSFFSYGIPRWRRHPFTACNHNPKKNKHS